MKTSFPNLNLVSIKKHALPSILKYILGTILLGLIFAGCKREESELVPQDSNPDNFKVAFNMFETFYNGHKVDSDTSVRFAVLFHFETLYTEYKWSVGSEEYYTRDLFLRFGFEDMNAPIPVTLHAKKRYVVNGTIVEKSDSARRYLVLKVLEKTWDATTLTASKVVKSHCLGSFTGSFTDSPSDIFTITNVDFGHNPSPSFSSKVWNARIYNFPKGCGNGIPTGNCSNPTILDIQNQSYAPEIDMGYLGFTLDGGFNGAGACCPVIKANGRIINEARDSIRIDCEIKAGDSPVQRRVFLGKRI